MRIRKLFLLIPLTIFVSTTTKSFGQLQGFDLLNVPIDVSTDFKSFANTYYLADSLINFDVKTASGQSRREHPNKTVWGAFCYRLKLAGIAGW